MIMVAEGARPVGGERVYEEEGKLGGVGEKVASTLDTLTGKPTRVVVLGHLLRGGAPTSFDRLISLRFGAAAVRALEEGQNGVMVALDPPTVRYVPLAEATSRRKTVPLDSDTILTARDLGICLGE
jgi:6-phosphofructokinase 1